MHEAPFPWFGGKRRVAPIVWGAFGNVQNYVEPFFGSGAVMLNRPHAPQIETINDKDALVSNFWRSIKHSPHETAAWADYPVNENDLHARHAWLVEQKATLTERIEGHPEFHNAKIAGWWVWGICAWIGSGWCSGNGPWAQIDGKLVKSKDPENGISRRLVHLGNSGRGVNKKAQNVNDWFVALSGRLRNVRVASGDWSRVCGPSVTINNGMTGVFLDPPYSDKANRSELYNIEDFSIAHDVREWCKEWGKNKLMRIALCGYDGEHNELESIGWRVVEWKARGGYGNQGEGKGRENSFKERIWLSPACLDNGLRLL